MTSESHIITQTRFELGFSSVEKNNALQEDVSNLFKNEISRKMDTLFSDLIADDQVFQIKQLTLDLGKINYNDLEKELPDRIIKSLKEAISKLKTDSPKASPDYTVISSINHKIKMIEHYLLTGNFNQQNLTNRFSIEYYLIEILTENASLLIQLLKRIGKKEHVRTRIAYQFDETTIIKLIQSLEPTHKVIITEYITEPLPSQKQNESLQTDMRSFKKAKYFFVLTYLFVEKGSVFNTRNFVRSLIKQMSAHYNIHYLDFLWMISQQIRLESNNFISKGLQSYIKEIFIEDFELSNNNKNNSPENSRSYPANDQSIKSDEINDEYLYFFIENGTTPIHKKNLSKEDLQYLISRLLKEKPIPFKHFISRNKSEKKIKNIVRFFSEKTIQEILTLFTPQNTEWIKSLAAMLENTAYFTQYFESKKIAKEKLYQAILNTVLKTDAGNFTKSSFFETLLYLLSKESELNLRDLKFSIESGFEKNGDKKFSELILLPSRIASAKKSADNNNTENYNKNDSAFDLEMIYTTIAKLQPEYGQWIITLGKTVLKAQSHFVFFESTHLSSLKREVFETILANTINYRSPIFNPSEFLKNVLSSFAKQSALERSDFMTSAKIALEKAGGNTYSKLINFPDTSIIKTHEKDQKQADKEVPSDDSYQEYSIKKTIHQLQPEHSQWILSLHQVILKANLLFKFTSSVTTSTLKTNLYRALLNTTIRYQPAIFNKSTFFQNFLLLVSKQSNIDATEFLSKAKEAIENTTGNTYSRLISLPTLYSTNEYLLTPENDKQKGSENLNRKTVSEEQEVTILLHFLINGKMPWWAEEYDFNPLKMLWQKHFIIRKKKRLVTFIKRNISTEELRKNLFLFLEDDLSNDTLTLSNKTDENLFLKKVLPKIHQTLNSKNSRLFVEAYLIYYFLKKEKSKERIWEDIQSIFSTKGIQIITFYKELLKLHESLSDTYLNDFFLIFHARLSEKLVLIEPTKNKVGQERDNSLAYLQPTNKDLSSSLNPDTIHEQEKSIAQSFTDHSLNDDGILSKHHYPVESLEKEDLRQLEILLHYLQTGLIPNGSLQPKQLILNVLEKFSTIQRTTNVKRLFLVLKNEVLFKRFISEFNEAEIENIINILFAQQSAFLENYIKDFRTLFSNKNLKRQVSSDVQLLLNYSLLFLIECVNKNITISDYIKFIAKKMFKNVSDYYTFSSITKIAIIRNEVRLHTFLPSILFTIMREEKKKEDKQIKPVEEIKQNLIFIENAGLIILSPFIPFYFETLGLIKEHKFTSKKAAIRGANLLQYLITGEEHSQEHAMALNKILCHLPKSHPVYYSGEFSEKEKNLSDDLLKTAISRWEILQNTSIEGLRNSFLKREGKIEWLDDKIVLTVEPKSFDMLVDKIPWNISVIKLPWMKQTLYVKWR